MTTPYNSPPITHCTENNSCPFGEVFYDDQCQAGINMVWQHLTNFPHQQYVEHAVDAARRYRCRVELQKVLEETLEVERQNLTVLGDIVTDEIEKIANGEA